MKIFRIFLLAALAAVSGTVHAQSNCENEKQDLAQILSGSYKCEIRTLEYGGTGEEKKSQGTVSITKAGENKVKISYGSNSYTIGVLAVEGNVKIVGEEPANDNNGSKSVNLSIFEKPATISGRSSNGTSEKEKKSWSFEGTANDDKPKSLNSEPACREIYVKPAVEFGGKVIKKRDVALCILGKLSTPVNTLSVKKAADEQQLSGVLVLETAFPEDEAWQNSSYEAQTKRFWEETNKPFIDDAIAQNAEMRWIIDPRLDEYKYGHKPKGANFDTTKDGQNISKVFSYTHFEYQYLLAKGYSLDAATGIMKK